VLVEAILSTACSAGEVDAELSSASLTLSTVQQSIQIPLPSPVCQIPLSCTFDVHTHVFCISLRKERDATNIPCSAPGTEEQQSSADGNGSLQQAASSTELEASALCEQMAIVSAPSERKEQTEQMPRKAMEDLVARARRCEAAQAAHVSQLAAFVESLCEGEQRTAAAADLHQQMQIQHQLRREALRVWTIVLADRVADGEQPSLPTDVEQRSLLRAVLHKRLEHHRLRTQHQMEQYSAAATSTLHQEIDASFELIGRLEATLGRLMSDHEQHQQPTQQQPTKQQAKQTDGHCEARQPAARCDRLDYSRWDEPLEDSDDEEEEAAKQVVQDRVRGGVHTAHGVKGHMDLINKILRDPQYNKPEPVVGEGEWREQKPNAWQDSMVDESPI